MKTIVYVDGFNLYYRALRERPAVKWLNPFKLAEAVLDPANVVTKLWYFTARVSGRLDPGAPARQQIFFDALKSVPEIEIKNGNLLVKKTWAGLCPPDLDPAKPRAKPPMQPWPDVVRIFRTEEKGSDVNLATQLLIDSFKGYFDAAAVITNDTDLYEPIRFVTQELKKVVGIITPVAKPATSLARVATFVRHIRDQHLIDAQFANPLVLEDGTHLAKPASWV